MDSKVIMKEQSTQRKSNIAHQNKDDFDNNTDNLKHCWIFDSAIDTGSSSSSSILTKDGLVHIENHKYVAGTYTILDNILNPYWIYLTELLPLWLAPNMITLIGCSFCIIGYIVTWIWIELNTTTNTNTTTTTNTENEVQITNVPGWILIMNGICTIVYYTFDCMDGKQARRTNTSSPLGQLFDHGIDCFCILYQISNLMIISGFYFNNTNSNSNSNENNNNNNNYGLYQLWGQSLGQLGFYVAQLEEYYTGTLPHANGNFGVTETNYSLGILQIIIGLFFCTTTNGNTTSTTTNTNTTITLQSIQSMTIISYLPQYIQNIVPHYMLYFPNTTIPYENNHLLLFGATIAVSYLILSSTISLQQHIYTKYNTIKSKNNIRIIQYSALSKLLSPLLLSIVAPMIILPNHILNNEARYVSIIIGLNIIQITIKLIVYSMAKQYYSTIQYKEVCIVLLLFIWIRYDTTITVQGIHKLFQFVSILSLLRLLLWTKNISSQICTHLHINLLTIPYDKNYNNNNNNSKQKKQ